MKKYIKRFLIIFLIICIFFSSIDIKALQALALEGEEIIDSIENVNVDDDSSTDTEENKEKPDTSNEDENNIENDTENKEKINNENIEQSQENTEDKDTPYEATDSKEEGSIKSQHKNSTESKEISENKDKKVSKINNEEKVFTYYLEDDPSHKTDCTLEELNEKIAKDDGDLVIELNKDIEIEPSYNGNEKEASIIFDGVWSLFTLDLKDHTITAKEKGYNIIYANCTYLTIKNGTIKNADTMDVNDEDESLRVNDSGAAIFAKDYAYIEIYNVELLNNRAKNGGAIYLEDSELYIGDDSKINNNESTFNGGAIFSIFNDMGLQSRIENTEIKGNKSSTGGGIAVRCDSNDEFGAASVSIIDCKISENNSSQGGMGINLYDNVSLYAENIEVVNNGTEGQNNKGAILIDGGDYENNITIIDSKISDNIVGDGSIEYQNYAAGLSIDTYENSIYLENTEISNNTGNRIGGLSIFAKGFGDNFSFYMEGGAIYGNKAKNEFRHNNDTISGVYANDVYISQNSLASIYIPSVNEMAKEHTNLAKHYWNHFSSKDGYKFESLDPDEELDLEFSDRDEINIYNVSENAIRYVAEINNKKYTKLEDAFKEAKDGDTIKLIAGEDDNTGIKIVESIKYSENKKVTVDLNGREWTEDTMQALTLEKDESGNMPHLIIKENGTISKIDLQNGILDITSKIKIEEITLGEGKHINALNDFDLDGDVVFKLDDKDISKLDKSDVTIINNETSRNLENLLSKISIKDANTDIILKIDTEGNIVVHKLKGVFVGDKGNDENTGEDANHPVKTFEAALEKTMEEIQMGEKIERIFVVDTITISDEEEWIIPKNIDITLSRYNDQKINLVEVKGKLTLKGITIDGESDKVDSGCYLIKVDNGAELNIEKGTILRNNSGGAVECKGHLVMKEGTISENTAEMGAGILIDQNGSFVLGEKGLNPVIKNNIATKAGGGIAVIGKASKDVEATFVMNSGEVSGNRTTSNTSVGGGIMIGNTAAPEETTFIMNGGKIENNYAYEDGGGLYIQANCKGTLNKGEIIGNTCTGGLGAVQGAYGGGGIYINGPRESLDGREKYPAGVLIIPTTAYISENTAGGLNGAGIAGCATSKVFIYDGGASIFNNNLEDGKVTDGSSQVYVNKYENWGTHGNISEAYIGRYAISGIQNHWTNLDGKELSEDELRLTNDKDENGKLIDEGKEIEIRNDNAKNLGLTKSKADVIIISNKSTNGAGGGIGTNGEVYIGTPDEEYEVDITVNKIWEDSLNIYGIRPDSITVHLYANGELVKTQEITKEDGWKYTFEKLPKYNDYGELIKYTISEDEVEGYKTIIDGTTIINTHHEEEKKPKTSTPENPKEIKPPKTGGILEKEGIEYKDLVVHTYPQILPIMLLVVLAIKSLKLLDEKDKEKNK